MYICIEKNTEKALIFKEKTALANYIGVHYRTISRRINTKPTEINGYIVVEASYVQGKSSRGGKRGTSWVKDW